MLRRSIARFDFGILGKTRFGAEAIAKTKRDMNTIDGTANPLLRYMTRKRKIDQLQIDVEGRIAEDLHPSFLTAINVLTVAVMGPLFYFFVHGDLQPTYYLMVSTNIVKPEKYAKVWDIANPLVVFATQVFTFAVFYDASIYVRMPFFAYVLAPLFRKFGPKKVMAKGTVTLQELKQKSAAMQQRKGVKGGANGSSPNVVPRPLGKPTTAAAAPPKKFGDKAQS